MPAPEAPAPSKSLVASLAWRMPLFAVAAGLMLFGFLVLPWVELRFPDRRVGIGYLRFADWFMANNVEVGAARGAYGQGLALLLAGVCLVVALAAIVVTVAQGRVAGWVTVVWLLLFVSALLSWAGQPTVGGLDVPWSGPPYALPGKGPLAVTVGHFALAFACPTVDAPIRRTTRR
ncbi:hypothetical protein AB0J86_17370 [Micromonospora sp. NPDC049559]|uniref:hypothetical protein n=1 Tax=Micromonospora sp. NPDC049559 TaxID=3155923 RepID=UPI0034131365